MAEDAQIVGWAHSKFGKSAADGVEPLMAEVIAPALEHAGIGAEDVDGLFVGCSIPQYRKSRRRFDTLKHVRETPGGALAEAVRNLRTSILLGNVDEPPKVVVVTSSLPEEGRSMISMLLGVVTAQMGKRAILIDADLRRPTVHCTLRLTPEILPRDQRIQPNQRIAHRIETCIPIRQIEKSELRHQYPPVWRMLASGQKITSV